MGAPHFIAYETWTPFNIKSEQLLKGLRQHGSRMSNNGHAFTKHLSKKSFRKSF